MTRSWFVLYRPSAPSVRAQTVQVLATAGALVERGHHVTVCVQTATSAHAIRRAHGLPDSLDLVRLPLSNSLASLAYRITFTKFLRRTRGAGVALARSKRHARWAVRWFGGRFRLILEAHEVDSLHPERNRTVSRELERHVLSAAWGVIANASGTLQDLRKEHRVLPPAKVIPNAARPGGPPAEPGQDIGWVGSIRPDKDPWTVAGAARRLSERIVLIGPSRTEASKVIEASGGALCYETARVPADVPERLRRFRTLVVPLSRGRFGDRWASPLKLFDALESGVPTVAADTRAVRAIAGDAFVPYEPGDVRSLCDALVRATRDESLRRRLRQSAEERSRTWSDRAAELEAFADEIL